MDRFLCAIYVAKENKVLVIGYIKLPNKDSAVFTLSMNKFIDIKCKKGKHVTTHPPVLFTTSDVREFAERWVEGNNRPLREETYERMIRELNYLRNDYKNLFINLTDEQEKEYTSLLNDDYILKRYESVPFANFIPYEMLDELRNDE